MRWSRYFLPTLREDPKDAEVISHKLMVRAGCIRRLGSGAYSYLPFGLRALQKAIAIVREEMQRTGAQELLLPALQPVELWKTTGRYDVLGDVLIRFKDRTGKEVALGPTHEEVVTDLLKDVSSHRQLPVIVYQIQTKFRDEPRPRGGVIRSKEFLMKDAYSFDADAAGLDRSYEAMYHAYERIFARCGLNVLACEADPGMMGGGVSHEFMAPSEHGEDRVVHCAGCGYAANLEAARCEHTAHRTQHTEQPKPMEAVKTPGKHTVEQVSTFLKVSPSKLIKTLLYDVDGGQVAVLVRGDHDVNAAKLARVLRQLPPEGVRSSGQSRAESRDVADSRRVKLASVQTIERLSGAPMGFTGPVRLPGVRLLVDHAVMGVVNGVTGANQAETHLIHVNPGRDFQPSVVADLRMVTEEDPCPGCGLSAVPGTAQAGKRLELLKAIEVGHVFKLGTTYSQALGAVVQDAAGAVKPMVMGCYGIGINRILAAAIEQRHDPQGIIWPVALSPFQILVSVLEAHTPRVAQAGTEAYEALQQAGYEVLLDDREHSPGSKLKDADLVGLPLQVIVGKTWQAEQRLEVTVRATKETTRVPPAELVETVHNLLDKLSSLQ